MLFVTLIIPRYAPYDFYNSQPGVTTVINGLKALKTNASDTACIQ
jgi:hypothetical protein